MLQHKLDEHLPLLPGGAGASELHSVEFCRCRCCEGVRREREPEAVDGRDGVQDAEPRGAPARVAQHPRQGRAPRARPVGRRTRGGRVRRPRPAPARRTGTGAQRRRARHRVDLLHGLSVVIELHTHTHTRLTPLYPGLPG